MLNLGDSSLNDAFGFDQYDNETGEKKFTSDEEVKIKDDKGFYFEKSKVKKQRKIEKDELKGNYKIFFPSDNIMYRDEDDEGEKKRTKDAKKTNKLEDGLFIHCERSNTGTTYTPLQIMNLMPTLVKIPKVIINSVQFHHLYLDNKKLLLYENNGRKFLLVPWEPLTLTSEQKDKISEYKHKNLDFTELQFLKIPRVVEEQYDITMLKKTSFWKDSILIQRSSVKPSARMPNVIQFQKKKKRSKPGRSVTFPEGTKTNDGNTTMKKKLLIHKGKIKTTPEISKFLKMFNTKPHQRMIKIKDRKRPIPKLNRPLRVAKDLHSVRKRSVSLLEFMIFIDFSGKIMKHILYGLVDEGSRSIAKLKSTTVDEALLNREVRIFRGLHIRLRKACHDFLQIYIEEYIKHSQKVRQEGAKFLRKINILMRIQPKEILERHDKNMKLFLEYISRKEQDILKLKGVLWDDKFKTSSKKLNHFKAKCKWIKGVINEILEEIENKYFRGQPPESDYKYKEMKEFTKNEEFEFLKTYFENENDLKKQLYKKDAKPFRLFPL